MDGGQFNVEQVKQYIFKEFDENALPALMDYVRIPNLSQAFDPEWNTNGLLDKAAKHLVDWFVKQNLKNSSIEILREDMKAPLIFAEIPRTDNSDKTILYYGHYDKQPHFTGWKEGFGPTTPVIKDDNLYGRGASDDGYAIFAAVLSIKACQNLGYQHPRIVLLIEGAEESSSQNFLYYTQKIKDKIGVPHLLICTDSGCGNYDTFWNTTSLRGNIKATLTVKVLEEGVHSGEASGIVPDSFRILRHLLERLENSKTGEIIPQFHVDIPPYRYQEALYTSQVLGQEKLLKTFPYSGNMQPVTQNPFQAYLNKTWRPQLSIVGAGGLPEHSIAGNVLRPETIVRLSLRTPPTFQCSYGGQFLKELMENDPPYGATVTCEILSSMKGWNSPEQLPYLQKALEEASQNFYQNPTMGLAEGGSIPLMNLLQEIWPNVQYLVTGVLGPNSNAHGPNEMLQLTYTKKLICCLVQVLDATSKEYSQ